MGCPLKGEKIIMMNTNKEGLTCFDFNASSRAAIDPDNVFWAIMKGRQDGHIVLSRKMLTLYEKVKNDLDIEMRDFRFSSKLSAIYIDPTDRCNANCPYCYVPVKIRKNGASMTQEQLEYILKKIAKYFKNEKKKAVIIFHASEPLLVKDIIFKAIKDFRDRFHFGLQTNAILMEKKDVEFLKKYRVGVGISLDSFNMRTNNRLRTGNFNKALEVIEWFRGYEGLNVITTVTKFNVTHLSKIVEFLHEKKVPCVLLNPVRLTQKNSHSLKPDENILIKNFIKAVDKAIELQKSSKHKIIIGNFSNIILGIIAPTARRMMCDISPCGGGRCFFTITASGNMIPCGEFIGLKGFSGGNIFKTTISKGMQSRPFKKIRSRRVEEISECNICTFRNLCGAPCPAELYSHGNMYGKAVFCEFYKEIIKYAFRLIAEREEKYLLRQDSFRDFQYNYCL